MPMKIAGQPSSPYTGHAARSPGLVDLRNRCSSLLTGVEQIVEHESRHDASLDRARAIECVALDNDFSGKAVDHVKRRRHSVRKARRINCSGFRVEKRRPEAVASIPVA